MSTDREKGTGYKRARVTRGSRNPKHAKGSTTSKAVEVTKQKEEKRKRKKHVLKPFFQ
jgi:hypothetical protein